MGKILKYWNKEEIIEALQKLPKDAIINKKSINEYSKKGLICHVSTIQKKFKTIKNACDIANVRCDALYGKAKYIYMSNILKRWSKKDIDKILKDLFNKGEIKSIKEYYLYSKNNNEIPSADTIRKYYKTLSEAFLSNNIDFKNYHWTNEQIINTLKKLNNKYGPLHISQINSFRKNKKICGLKTIRERFGSVEKAAKLAGFNFIEPIEKGNKFNGKIGKRETEVLNIIELNKSIKLERQYRVQIDNKVYFIDGYDKENNIAYEIDEKLHRSYNQKILDNIKDNNLKKVLNCEIQRININ